MTDSPKLDPEDHWTPRFAAGRLADQLGQIEDGREDARIAVLIQDTYGLLRGMHLGKVQAGCRRILDNSLEIIERLPDSKDAVARELVGIVSMAAAYGLSIEGHQLDSRHRQRKR